MARSHRALAIAVAALGLTGGCKREQDAPAPATNAAPSAPAPLVLAATDFYRVEARPAPCAPGAACATALELIALGRYKLNADYPFKFVPAEGRGVAIEHAAALQRKDDKHGTLPLRFRAAASGPTALVGVLKLSVCTTDTCEIAEPAIDLRVPAS